MTSPRAKRRGRPPTIIDVAKEAKVGVMSVSRVINNHPRVKLSTRTKVMKAIAKIGYSPNDAARMLRGRRGRTIGLVVPDLSDFFYQPLLIEANRVEVLVQPIEECLKLLFRPVPIADGNDDMLCEEAERHGIESGVAFTAPRPRPTRMFCVSAVKFVSDSKRIAQSSEFRQRFQTRGPATWATGGLK
jgi:Bacterial regulatory proteins, lacI family